MFDKISKNLSNFENETNQIINNLKEKKPESELLNVNSKQVRPSSRLRPSGFYEQQENKKDDTASKILLKIEDLLSDVFRGVKMPLVQFPRKKVRGVSEVGLAMVDLIKKNIIAKTNVTSNVLIGSNVVSVENTFHFRPDEEIVLIDWGYNDENSPHYQIYEYAKIKEINNTSSITLQDNVQSDWYVSEQSFIQKTIGHSPLYENNVYYGDREVIPMDQMAITIEPQSLSNEWLYIQGGLSEEYRMMITIFGKSIKMEDGKLILDRYSDAVYQMFNENMHFNVSDYFTPLKANVVANATSVVVADTPENRVEFVPTGTNYNYLTYGYVLQDNYHSGRYYAINSVSFGSGLMTITLNEPIRDDFLLSDYAVLRRIDRYFYDSRVDGIVYGEIQKGSAFLRAGQLSWFGKWVNNFKFPQPSSRIDYFKKE